MSDRYDFFVQQIVAEDELDAAFEAAEDAERALAVDNGHAASTTDRDSGGIFTGLVLSNPGTLDVDISAGVAYDDQGRRCATSSVLQVDISQTGDTAVNSGGTPAGGVSTAPGAGLKRWVSLFIVYDRLLQDPRVDGVGTAIFFERLESFHFNVEMGAAAASPLLSSAYAVPTAGRVHLGDFLINNTGTVESIDVTRRQNWFRRVSGGAPTVRVGSGFAKRGINSGLGVRDVLESLLGYYNDHVADAADNHSGAGLSFTPDASNWRDGNPALAAITVEAAINETVTDLAADAGAARIGAAASAAWKDGTTNPAEAIQTRLNSMVTRLGGGTTGAAHLSAADLTGWHDATGVAPTTKSIQNMLQGIITALAATSGQGGADKIGAAAQQPSIAAVTAGSIYDQITELLQIDDTKAGLSAANIFTNALNTFRKQLKVGDNLIATQNEAETARLDLHAAPYSVSEFTLISEQGVTGAQKLRTYVHTNSLDIAQYIMTINARWDGSAWYSDTSTDPAFYFRFGTDFQLYISKRPAPAGTSWATSVWGSGVVLALDDTALYLYDDLFLRPGPTDITPITQPVANALYSKNVVKAWGFVDLVSGVLQTPLEGFNWEASSPTASYITITFKRTMYNAQYAVAVCGMSGTARIHTVAAETVSGFNLYAYDTSGLAIDFNTASHQFGFVVLARQ